MTMKSGYNSFAVQFFMKQKNYVQFYIKYFSVKERMVEIVCHCEDTEERSPEQL